MSRIAMISEHASPLAALGGVDAGGQNVYVAKLAQGLVRLGHTVDVFTRRDDPGLPPVATGESGVRVVHVPAGPAEPVPKETLLPYMDAFTDGVLEHMAQEGTDYDLIHAHFWMSGRVAADLKRAVGLPFVVTFHALGLVRRRHQGDADAFPDERFEIEGRVAREADRIVAECPQDEADLVGLYGADPERIEVIPCGFDPDELWPVDRAQARAELGLPQDAYVVLQLGRMVPRKGVDDVVRGFARMEREHGVEGRLVVVGGDAPNGRTPASFEVARLQRIARAEGVAERVLFTGQRERPRLRSCYSAADVFVTTPWYEPFGITPVEAMACGVPVVGARVGGIKHTVLPDETGLLVPTKDPDAVASRLAWLHHHPDVRRRMGRAGLHRAHRHFTWSHVCARVDALYREVVSAQPDGASDGAAESDLVDRGFGESMAALEQARRRLRPAILEVARALEACFAGGGTVLACGNGGSAADAQHFATELVGRFVHRQRAALPVVALTADTAVLTAWSNDVGYRHVFARQVEALGRRGDVLLGISTSGRSENVREAFERARHQGVRTVAIVGGDGGPLRHAADLAVVVPSDNPQRIQEIHTLVLHLVCELVERSVLREAPAASEDGAPAERSRPDDEGVVRIARHAERPLDALERSR